ncbi:hypothetical protein [Pantoea stewartii]|uniref:hypothetical protein n=1 Tax=Pantoea stewartii TaxID=66269 RepID=UPI00197CE69D|nr:hypothetical protein [Pantoea stewartii]
MTSNDDMEQPAEWQIFLKWWRLKEQSELRESCAPGWGFYIWQAALKSKQGEV